MPKNAPVGVGSFRKLISPENDYLFVDRTDQIPLLLSGEEVTAIHTFRRSGKSLFASMAAHFFAKTLNGLPTKGLFKHLSLGKNNPDFVRKHQGQYPTVFMSLKGVKAISFKEACAELLQVLQATYDQHDYLIDSEKLSENDRKKFSLIYSVDGAPSTAQLQSGLLELTRLLYKHHSREPVVVILDEYDAPLTTAYRHGYLDEFMPVYKEFLSNGLKDNDYLKKGLLLGILRIARESILSGLNNPEIYTLLNPGPYQPYFGFTEDEVTSLFRQAGLNHEIEAVKRWYNGYRINGQSLYNPWSVMKCINQSGALRPHWVNTSNDDLLKKSLLNAPTDVKQQFERLMTTDEGIEAPLTELVRFEEVHTDPKALWGLLYQTGYLTTASVLNERRTHYEGKLVIPNEEIKGLYVDFFADWLTTTLGPKHNHLLKSLSSGDMEQFSRLLGDFLAAHASLRNLHYEGSYHNLVLGLISGLFDTHYVFSDTLESGLGYADLFIIPHEKSASALAILIEIKRATAKEDPKTVAEQGLSQITQQRYESKLVLYPHVSTLLKVGMAFSGKSVTWVSEEARVA